MAYFQIHVQPIFRSRKCDFSKAADFQKVSVFRSRLALLYEFNHKILEMNIPLLNKHTTKKKTAGVKCGLRDHKMYALGMTYYISIKILNSSYFPQK